MEALGEILIGLLILVGLVGILVPILPGLLLVMGAVIGWAVWQGGSGAWTVAGVAIVLGVGGTVVSYLVPGRRLRNSGIPTNTLLMAGALAIAGFFIVPIVGGPGGFVLGIYIAEHQRVGPDQAWPSTKASLRAVGLSIIIELIAGLFIAGIWLAAVLFG